MSSDARCAGLLERAAVLEGTVYRSATPQYANSMPRTFAAIEFALELVLDLTNGRNRQAIAISEMRLLGCDWRAALRTGKTPITQ